MRTPGTPDPSSGNPPDSTPIEVGVWILLFIAATLLAQAGLPFWVGQRMTALDDEIAEVIEPARSAASDLAVVQARAMARFQEYLMTGDADARRRYQDLTQRESDISNELAELLRRTHPRVRGEILPLLTASGTWHLGHRDAILSEQGRTDFLTRVDEDQDRYDAVLAGAQRLRDALSEETQRGRNRLREVRAQQLTLTVVLVALALLATVGVGLVGNRLRDLMTEARERGVESLRARREVDAILEATSDGVVRVDLDGRPVTMNGAATRLLGYSEEDARRRTIHEIVHGSDPAVAGHDEADCPLLEAVQLGVVETFRDDVAQHRRGDRFPVRWSARPMVDGRRVSGVVLTLADITEVHEAEKALREAVYAREQTLAVVSHDLRNPLGSVSAAAELLLEVPLPEERRRQQLETIRRSAERMNRLIQDLLDIARIDAGGLSVRPEICHVSPLLREAADLVALRAGDSDVTLAVECDGEDMPRVRADHDRVLQVLTNLLVNGVRHTPPGGRITLSCGGREDGMVILEVSDTGSGIPEHDREHLFERFWRPDGADAHGAGLGLAIVKGIVEAHGGRVWVESETGQGSTFRFTLPAAR
jgi:PAS domain S-box-containing protein